MDNIVEALQPLSVDIDAISVDEKNARTHPAENLGALKRSLTYYGQRKPVVVRLDDRVIEAGNGMWEAAKELGWDKIAAVMVEDDPTNASGFAIMDNQSALLSEWDFPMLKDLLENLDTGAFDMDLTGFSSEAIEDLMTQLHIPEDGLTDDDAIPDDVETVCKKGDLQGIGR